MQKNAYVKRKKQIGVINLAIDIKEIDIERLRQDLINYYVGAAYMLNASAALETIEKLQNASDNVVHKVAIAANIDLSKYIKGKTR